MTCSSRWSRRVTRAQNGAWKRLHDERGVAMVEFAIVSTMLFILICGILFLGLYINYQLDETHLANEAARYAAVGQVPSGCASTLASCIRSQANSELQNGSSSVTPVSVCVANGAGGTGNVGDPVTVTVTSQYSFVPILNLVPITDSETATMRLETPTSSNSQVLGCAS